MRKVNLLWMLSAAVVIIVSCGKVSYKKTSSGLVYKLFPSSGKDSLLRDGQIAKVEATAKLNDSTFFSSYGRVPVYIRIQSLKTNYDLLEILLMMKKGDSAVCVQVADSLIKKGQQLPENTKKGDRITTTLKIVEVFTNDSIAQADYNMAMEKDRPNQVKLQEEQMAKMRQEMKEQTDKELAELEKSGEMAKQDKVVQDYLSSRKINAQKTGRGTYVEIKNQGSTPLAADGKYVTVEYKGRIMRNDSSFESGTYPLQLGQGQVIQGWEEGLKLFGKGGVGTIYIPGYRAYGKNPRPDSPFKQDEALIFDVTIRDITDTMPRMPQEQPKPVKRLKNN